MSPDVEDALELADEILAIIEDDISDEARERGSTFFDDVEEKVKAVRETIETRKQVTPRQLKALEGWRDGVRKWVH